MKWSDRIRIMRAVRAVRQDVLARSVGVSQGRMSMIERGISDPTDMERTRIREALNWTESVDLALDQLEAA